MSTYKDYQQQIADLQKLADKARQEEIILAKQQIREIMTTYHLTIDDLRDKAAFSRKSAGPVKAKYRDPETGKQWTGRGREPKWMVGQDRAKFAIAQ